MKPEDGQQQPESILTTAGVAAETEAIRLMSEALLPLDREARERVHLYVARYFNLGFGSGRW
jgi:hypothetical protein